MLGKLKTVLLFLVKTAAALMVLVSIGALATWITIQVLINKEEVEVPDLTGMSTRQAVSALDKLSLSLSIDEERSQYSDEVPSEHILRQEPPAGTRLKIDRTVKVILSLGSGSLEIPDLTGSPTQKARILLQERGLNLGSIARVHSDRFPANTIMAQDPPAGAGTSGRKTVSLLESLGPELRTFLMPDFTYYRFDVVNDFFERHSIRVRTEYRAYEGLQDGIVIKTKPHPGYPLREHDIVSVFVSRADPMTRVGAPERRPGRRPTW